MRPEVKRTYSRLKKETTVISEVSESIEAAEIEVDVKVDKMRKITDFFKVKRGNYEECSFNEEVMISSASVSSSSSVSAPAPASSSLSAASPLTSVSNKLKQTYLDLGQKNLISSQCPDCLMNYNKSFLDDLNLHKKFHSNYLKGYNFNLKIDDEIVLEMAPKDLMKWKKIRFYEIKRFEPKILKKLEFFMNFVHVQLGAEPLAFDELKENGKFDAIVVVDHLTNKILAFGLFEKCSKIFKSLENCENSAIELENEEIISEKFEFIGVSRIWVDEKHRSMGLAGTMLDLKCKGQRERVAFSQPTPSGFAFAKSYQKVQFKGKGCLIYLK